MIEVGVDFKIVNCVGFWFFDFGIGIDDVEFLINGDVVVKVVLVNIVVENVVVFVV